MCVHTHTTYTHAHTYTNTHTCTYTHIIHHTHTPPCKFIPIGLLCPWRILQSRILELVHIPLSRESSWPRDWTQVWSPALQADSLLSESPRKPSLSTYIYIIFWLWASLFFYEFQKSSGRGLLIREKVVALCKFGGDGSLNITYFFHSLLPVGVCTRMRWLCDCVPGVTNIGAKEG